MVKYCEKKEAKRCAPSIKKKHQKDLVLEQFGDFMKIFRILLRQANQGINSLRFWRSIIFFFNFSKIF